MFAVVDAALWRPLPFEHPGSLAILYVTRTTAKDGLVRLRWSRPVSPAYHTLRIAPGAGRVFLPDEDGAPRSRSRV